MQCIESKHQFARATGVAKNMQKMFTTERIGARLGFDSANRRRRRLDKSVIYTTARWQHELSFASTT